MNGSPSRPIPNNVSVVVIGAGVVGMNSALALIREGFKVTVIDRLDPGEGCSSGNAGILGAWSFVPLFGPDVLRSIPGYLLDRAGPLTIRWTRLLQILPWLFRMLPYASAGHIKLASEALHHLTAGCAEAYEKLAAEAGCPELVKQDPVLQVYDSEAGFRKGEANLSFRATYGVKYEALDDDALRDIEPALGPRFRWGHALRGGGTTTNPGRLVKVLARSFRKLGGEIRKEEVRGLERTPCGFSIQTDGKAIAADRLVIAAGAYSHRLARMLGERFPLGTERGYHALIADPQIEVRHTVGWKAQAFYASPMEMGLRIAGTVELAGLDAPPDFRRADVIARHAMELFPGLNPQITSKWMGFRPTLPDSLPVIDRSRNVPGLFFAFGHQHIGLTCGPATGRIIAQMVNGETPNIDVSPFRADRFHSGALSAVSFGRGH